MKLPRAFILNTSAGTVQTGNWGLQSVQQSLAFRYFCNSLSDNAKASPTNVSQALELQVKVLPLQGLNVGGPQDPQLPWGQLVCSQDCYALPLPEWGCQLHTITEKK